MAAPSLREPAPLPSLATPALARRRLLVSSCRRECQHRPSRKRGGVDAARDVSCLLRAASLTPLAAATIIHCWSPDATLALAVARLASSVPARSLSSWRSSPPVLHLPPASSRGRRTAVVPSPARVQRRPGRSALPHAVGGPRRAAVRGGSQAHEGGPRRCAPVPQLVRCSPRSPRVATPWPVRRPADPRSHQHMVARVCTALAPVCRSLSATPLRRLPPRYNGDGLGSDDLPQIRPSAATLRRRQLRCPPGPGSRARPGACAAPAPPSCTPPVARPRAGRSRLCRDSRVLCSALLLA